MRVFAKDVSGQKLDRGFKSRPLRFERGAQRQRAYFTRMLNSSAVSISLIGLV